MPTSQAIYWLQAIVRHNFRADFSEHANCQRIYAVNDEAGLLLCSWPNGGRPRYPFPYADEVWTGIEYQVAAHCLYEGLIEQGLEIVKAVRDRYDGAKRNPWDEVECGHHYARAMSSWSLILALSGFRWDATSGTLAFAPQVNERDFRCFFSTGSGWGTFEQRQDRDGLRAAIRLLEGDLTLRALIWSASLSATHSIELRLDDQPLLPPHASAGRIEFAAPITLAAGQALRMEAS